MNVKTRSLWRLLVLAVMVSGLITPLVYGQDEYNGTRLKKAEAKYCMTCGCKNPVYSYDVDDPTFFPAPTATIKTVPGWELSFSGVGYVTVKAKEITTQKEDAEKKGAEFTIASSKLKLMKGYNCRLSGRYKTENMKPISFYGLYRLKSDPDGQFRPLPTTYMVGVPENNGANGWQTFHYDFLFFDYYDVEEVTFVMNAPQYDVDNFDDGYTLLVSDVNICSYYRDEFKDAALLSDLSAWSGSTEIHLKPDRFRPYTTHYHAVDVFNGTSIGVKPTAKWSDKSTIKITDEVTNNETEVESGSISNVSLKMGENVIPIDVEMENGLPMRYKVVVDKGTDGRLSSCTITPSGSEPEQVLSLANGKLQSNQFDYTAHVKATVSSVNLSVTAMDPSTSTGVTINSVTKTTGQYDLEYGDNKFVIEVTPSAGVALNTKAYNRIYTLIIKRAMDVSLTDLSIVDGNGEAINYNPTITEGYETFYADDISASTITVSATATDGIVEYHIGHDPVTFPMTVPDGKTEVIARVISNAPANPEVKDYTVVLKKGVCATLNDIKFNSGGTNIEPRLVTGNDYYVYIPQENSSVSFAPEACEQGATLSYIISGSDEAAIPIVSNSSSDPIQLNNYEEKRVLLKVTSHDGNASTDYRLILLRGAVPLTMGFEETSDETYCSENLRERTITVSLNAPVQKEPVTVEYYVEPSPPFSSPAQSPGDYTLEEKPLTFEIGEQYKTFKLNISSSQEFYSEDRMLQIKLRNPSGATIDPAKQTMTFGIYARTKVSFGQVEGTMGYYSQAEADNVEDEKQIYVMLDDLPSTQVKVNYSLVPFAGSSDFDAAVEGVDFTIPDEPRELLFNSSTRQLAIPVGILPTGVGSDKQFQLELSIDESYAENKRIYLNEGYKKFTFTINNIDQTPPTLTLAAPAIWLRESNSITGLTVTATAPSGITNVQASIDGLATTIDAVQSSETASEWTFGSINNLDVYTPITITAKAKNGKTEEQTLYAFTGKDVFKVIPPDNNEFSSNSAIKIEWKADPVIISGVDGTGGGIDVFVSYDDGVNWGTEINEDGAVQGESFTWTPLVRVTNTFKVKIKSHEFPGVLENTSDRIPLTGDCISPDAGKIWKETYTHTIQWPLLYGPNVKLEKVDIYCDLNYGEVNETSEKIAAGVSNTGQYEWFIPYKFVTEFTKAKIRVVDPSDEMLQVESKEFVIKEMSFVRKYIMKIFR